jgi:hypothetical protein
VDSAAGFRLSNCFTADIVPIGPTRSWNPFQKNFSHGPAQRLLNLYPGGQLNFGPAIANAGTVIIDGCYFRVPLDRWREGFELLLKLSKKTNG